VLRRLAVLLVAALAAAVAATGFAPAASTRSTAVAHRIVSLSPTATESLFAIGAGKQVVAVDDQSDYPKAAPHTKLSGLKPNIEAIVGYKPDLVIAQYDPGDLKSSLAQFHVPLLLQPSAATLQDAYDQIQQLGAASGQPVRAKLVVAGMRKRIAKLVAGARGLGKGLSVYHELDPTLYSATSRTFVGQVYTLFGLRDIADAADSGGSGYPQLSPEYVVSQNPDLIVLADVVCCGQSPKTVASRPGWDRIAAVRSGLVVRIDDSIASRWGPRTVDFVKAVASALSHVRR
jgi:iron complex transport system substrate-binding protein